MITRDAQVRKLMQEMTKHGKIGLAATRAGMDRKTARRYVEAGKLPSELTQPRTWRTRQDPFAEDWPWVEEKLRELPTLEVKALFEALRAHRPGIYEEGQLRTLQRHVKQWRAKDGPDQEVFFPQQHRAGEAGQTDFTWATELEITILGVALVHMLCHFVLPFSNWQWVTVCASESMAALKRGVQSALFRLGRRPSWHQTDNSTAATHEIGSGDRAAAEQAGTGDVASGRKRPFNAEYAALMAHFGMKPRTTAIGAKEQNGDVESGNGALKRRLEQQLLLRGSRDFESVEQYESWAQEQCDRANAGRSSKLAEELAVMEPITVVRLPEHVELDALVSSGSTIRIAHNTYSVPSRLIGEYVRVRLFERRLEVVYGGTQQLTIERLVGRNGHRVDYRHVIWSLVRKPGAFARYRYRESFFPTLAFRRAYDAIVDATGAGTEADLAYLRVLHLAAATMECEVETAIARLLEEHRVPDIDAVRAIISPAKVVVPVIDDAPVDLCAYDALLVQGAIA